MIAVSFDGEHRDAWVFGKQRIRGGCAMDASEPVVVASDQAGLGRRMRVTMTPGAPSELTVASRP